MIPRLVEAAILLTGLVTGLAPAFAAAAGSPAPGSLFAQPETFRSFQRAGSRVDIQTSVYPIRVEVLADDLLKIRLGTSSAFGDESSQSVARSVSKASWEAVGFDVQEDSARLLIRARQIQLQLDKNPVRLTVLDGAGRVLLRESSRLTDTPQDHFNHPPMVEFYPRRRLGVAFEMGSQEHFYGLGEKVRDGDDQSLDWRGRKRDPGLDVSVMGNHTDGVDGAANGNFTVPFLYSSAGYGLFLDTAYKTYWEFDQPGRWQVLQDCDEDWEAGRAICARSEPRFYVMSGPEPRKILERYTELTGRAILPPRWMLGYLQSKNGFKSWAEAEQAASRIKAAGFPLSGLFLDLYWFGGAPGVYGASGEIEPQFRDCRFRHMGALQWSEADPFNFSGHKEGMARLEAQGIKTVLIEEGYFDSCTPNFAEAESRGFLARKDFGSTKAARFANGDDATDESSVGWAGQVGMIDTSQKDARDWFWKLHLPMLQDGAATFWTDLGEPERFRWWWKYPGHLWQQDIQNTWDLLRARAFFEGFSRDLPARRPFILSRSGYAGSQRFGAGIWTGDVPSRLKWASAQPGTEQNLGISGLPFSTSDIGGYGGHPVSTAPEFTRWLEMGAFSPLTRLHGKTNDDPDRDRIVEPDLFPEPYRSINLKYLKLRQELLPYLYTHAREAFDTGYPIMRALALEWPADPQVADLGSEYLFGPNLLVAPVLRDAVSRDVYLPAGQWIDFHDGTLYEGARWLKGFAAPIDKLPLFAKQGSVIPLGPEDAGPVAPAWLTQRTLLVYPGKGARYTLYDDDGMSNDYLKGSFSKTEIEVEVSDGSTTTVRISPSTGSFTGQPEARVYDLELYQPVAPHSVRVDTEDVPIAQGSGRPLRPGASWDAARKKLWVIAPAPRPLSSSWAIEVK